MGFARKDLYDAANGIGTIDCGCWATQDFNALNLPQRQMCPRSTTLHFLRAIAHTVDQDDGVLVTGSSNIDPRALTKAAIA